MSSLGKIFSGQTFSPPLKLPDLSVACAAFRRAFDGIVGEVMAKNFSIPIGAIKITEMSFVGVPANPDCVTAAVGVEPRSPESLKARDVMRAEFADLNGLLSELQQARTRGE